MFLNKVKKGVALSLTLLMISAPVANAAYDAEPSIPQQTQSVAFSISDIDAAILNFYNKYGNEDVFKVISDEDGIKTEVNGFQGVLRMTSYNETGEIVSVDNIEFIKNLEDMKNQASSIQLRAIAQPTKTTGGVDPFSLTVYTGGNYNSDFQIKATGFYGHSKTYYKNDSWYSGNTAGLYNNIVSAGNQVSNIKKAVISGAAFAAVMASLKQYVVPNVSSSPSAGVFTKIFAALGFGFDAAAVAVCAVGYVKDVLDCSYYYNKL